MRNEQYYKEKQARAKLKSSPERMAKTIRMASMAIGELIGYFAQPKHLRPSAPDDKLGSSLKSHKRSPKERRKRRQGHRSMMRNHG